MGARYEAFEALKKNSRLVDQKFNKILKKLPTINNFCLLATGSYGRQELFAQSDLDLLFLERDRGAAKNFAPKFAEKLWQEKITVSYSLRTAKECHQLALSDHKVLTTILDLRFIAGDRQLFANFLATTYRQICLAKKKELIKQISDERKERLSDLHRVCLKNEPNLKNGIGGLRDYHQVLWLAKVVKASAGADALSFLGRSELRLFMNSLNFLFLTRLQLHKNRKKPGDLLDISLQQVIAKQLHYRAKNKSMAAVKFMKDLLYHLTRIRRISDLLLERISSTKVNNGNKKIRAKELNKLLNIIEQGKGLSEEIKQQLRNREQLRINGPLRKRIMALLDSKKSSRILISLLAETDLIEAWLPPFRQIRYLTQLDYYHDYPVGTHSLLAAKTLASLKEGSLNNIPEVLKRALNEIDDFPLLLLAALLHDIGKSNPAKGHAARGAKQAARIVKIFNLNKQQAKLLHFLIEQHLLLSKTAQRCDYFDPIEMYRFVAEIKTLKRLNYLLLLTFADLKSLGLEGWNSYRQSLIVNLYFTTRDLLLEKEGSQEPRSIWQHRLKQLLKELKINNRRRQAELINFIKPWPRSYLLSAYARDAWSHLKLIEKCKKEDLALQISPGSDEFSLLAICCRDRQGLFAAICGALTLQGINIHAAQLFSSKDGIALDFFLVKLPSKLEQEINEQNNRRFKKQKFLQDLRLAVASGKEIATRMKLWQKRALGIDPVKEGKIRREIKIDNLNSLNFTVAEIYARDRHGLLFDLSTSLSDLGHSIHLAKINTEGQQAADIFYLQNKNGKKITAKNELIKIKRKISRQIKKSL